MRTSFTEEQLKDKDNRSSEAIIRKCVHCGFCIPTCPSYKVLTNESDSPRGRIYMIKDMIENQKKPTENIVKHVDRCLSCCSCMTTCPSGVNYMHIIDHGRNYIEKNYQRPFWDKHIRNVLSFVIPNHRLFRLAGFLTKFAKPFKFLFPKKIKSMITLMPTNFPKKKMKDEKIYPVTNGNKISRVALLTGCVQKVIAPEINEATIRLLNRHGVEVVIPPKINCCGSLNHHLGKERSAHEEFKNNIHHWYDEYLKDGLDAIISNTSGCGTTIKDYGFIFREDSELKKKAKKISELTKDISEYLSDNLKLNFKDIKNTKVYKIAYHSACSMQHGQKIHSKPMDLLKKTGNEILEIPDGHLCCGSAGTYNMLQAEIADKLLKEKIKNIDQVKPDLISTGNIGCISQISNGTKIPILHTVEIIDWYTGGPQPEILRKL
jgi:glycolate oxidase iron-sulfur subunit|tara:strand:- start:67 stop:1368 length:1302 start_codon:yes stop_codon:yes gene_type:complete